MLRQRSVLLIYGQSAARGGCDGRLRAAGSLSEKERRAYVQRMSRTLLLEAAEVARLYNPDDESREEES